LCWASSRKRWPGRASRSREEGAAALQQTPQSPRVASACGLHWQASSLFSLWKGESPLLTNIMFYNTILVMLQASKTDWLRPFWRRKRHTYPALKRSCAFRFFAVVSSASFLQRKPQSNGGGYFGPLLELLLQPWWVVCDCCCVGW